MLENHNANVQSPESIATLNDEHIETVHFSPNAPISNDPSEIQETSSKKKIVLKPKKKYVNINLTCFILFFFYVDNRIKALFIAKAKIKNKIKFYSANRSKIFHNNFIKLFLYL